MIHEIVVAGFGGQGVLLLGKILAYAAILDGKETTWISSYGVEMRGGTANCSVVISDRGIGSPIVTEPTAAIVLNSPSLEKFEQQVTKEGILIVNSSLVQSHMFRPDIHVYAIPCSDIAVELGNPKGANLVALGGLLAATGAVSRSSALKAIKQSFEGKLISASGLELLVQKGFDCVIKIMEAEKLDLAVA
ncbi:MAG TPA: 2-oxoacid:acceptor oxidoreductase family protein [Ktedonobacteraceae bacterium]|nr:2-oxoacid:acceptor oxidoreductase family protein [Ktedonobacteraceae bacterium]